VPSPLGTLLLVTEGDTVRALDFHDYQHRLHRLLRLHYGAYQLSAAAPYHATRPALDAYFEGDLTAIDSIAVATNGTVFQQKVWTALRPIPPGTTCSYSALAARIGAASAHRAVGAANGANPIAIIIPCHRLAGANAKLTGYGGGLERKQWLLNHEARR
jgi:methylated-DNA-[protein]-cysteine S-methyltransferase